MSTIIKAMGEILEGVAIGDVFITDGNGGWHTLELQGPGLVEVELYPGEELDLQAIRDSLADIWGGMPPAWQLKDDGMPGVYGPDAEAELVDTLSTRVGAFVVALLNTRQVCHKCDEQDCYLNGEPESAGVVLLEPTPL